MLGASSDELSLNICCLPINLDWILNPSGFLESLTMTVQTKVSNILPFSYLTIIKNWKCPFSWSVASESWSTWNKFQGNGNNSSYIDNLCACCSMGHSKWDIWTTHQKNSSDCPCPPSLYLRMLQAWHPRDLLTGSTLDLDTGFIPCSNH